MVLYKHLGLEIHVPKLTKKRIDQAGGQLALSAQYSVLASITFNALRGGIDLYFSVKSNVVESTRKEVILFPFAYGMPAI